MFITPAVNDGWLGVLTKDWQVGLICRRAAARTSRASVNGDNALTNTPQRAVVVPGVDPYLPESERVWVPNNASKAIAVVEPGGLHAQHAWHVG